MRFFSNFVLLILLMLFTGCLNSYNKAPEQNKQADSLNSISANDTSFLDDGNFVYRNLTSTVNVIFADKTSKVYGVDIRVKYADTTFKREYFMLSGEQAGFLIAPFLPKDYGVKYVKKQHVGVAGFETG
jgi:hypothetical protein